MEKIFLHNFTLELIDVKDIEHAYAYLELLNDPVINSNMYSIDYFIGEFDDVLLNSPCDQDYFIRMGNLIIGFIEIDVGYLQVCVSASLFACYRGLGYMTQVLQELIVYLQEHFNESYTLKAYVKSQNVSSQKVLNKVGFVRKLSDSEDSIWLYQRKLSK